MKTYSVKALVEVTVRAEDADAAREWVEQNLELYGPYRPTCIDDVDVQSVELEPGQ